MSTDEANEPVSLQVLLSRQLALLRVRADLSQDGLARRLRRDGLNWHRTTVAAVENGRRPVTIGELLVVSRALGLDLADWIGDNWVDDRVVRVTEDPTSPEMRADVAAGALRAAFRGDDAGRWRDDACWDTPRTRPGTSDVDELRAQIAAGEAEDHLARSIGIEPDELVRRSFARWGRTLTDERDRRVEEQGHQDRTTRSIQGIRGHVTRQLVEELLEGDADGEETR